MIQIEKSGELFVAQIDGIAAAGEGATEEEAVRSLASLLGDFVKGHAETIAGHEESIKAQADTLAGNIKDSLAQADTIRRLEDEVRKLREVSRAGIDEKAAAARDALEDLGRKPNSASHT